MKSGDLILIPFPFSEHSGAKKVRPAVLVCQTADVYRDLVVCAVSSVVPESLNAHEIRLSPDAENQLRKPSVLKVDRIVTIKSKEVIARLGSLAAADFEKFQSIFRNLI